ncbi:hypothetical protein R3W88_019155 [Solanum pinnatisectum]|uniref:Uncharacterized protein n=1 Tax=Solanum pinnatisectum TaxID=50273 RepID=A0AAV9KK29_9SOLN|nr:hypothetical protein R3W88_019155 [Solanum pinnatisectum]
MTNSSQVNAATTSVAHNRSIAALAPADKPTKFSGVDFKRWQQKMFFYLTTLSLQRFINENVPVMSDETPPEERFLVTEAWTHSDFLFQELQIIIHDLLAEGLVVNDAFQVVAIIEKLPQLWKDFKNYLKHKRKKILLKISW